MVKDYKIRIAVCDNDQRDRMEIVEMTKNILQKESILYTITAYDNAKNLLLDIENGDHFHILLLNVSMDDMDGIELAEKLRMRENKAAIILVSGNREMALRGYEVSAARYLEKSLNEEKLKEALIYCSRNRQGKREILLPTSRGQCRILVSDIQYVEAFDRGTRFVLTNDMIECRLKFAEAEAILPTPPFLLCHRAYIVNLSFVKYIRNYEFELKNGTTVAIGKGRYSGIYKKFVDYLDN